MAISYVIRKPELNLNLTFNIAFALSVSLLFFI